MGQHNETHKGPGKADRDGISVMELAEMFPDEASAVKWFESQIWPDGERCCGKCGGLNTSVVKSGKPMPYRCNDCRSYFSCRTGTVLEQSRIPVKKWVWAIYLCVTSLKGVSSMKLHRDLGVTQKTAWFMFHRLREAWQQGGPGFTGPIEMDETYMGGLESNKHASKKLRAGRGTVGKTPVMGAKDRETKKVKRRSSKASIRRRHETSWRELLVQMRSLIFTAMKRPFMRVWWISSMRLSSIRSASMCEVKPIRTASSPSGRC